LDKVRQKITPRNTIFLSLAKLSYGREWAGVILACKARVWWDKRSCVCLAFSISVACEHNSGLAGINHN